MAPSLRRARRSEELLCCRVPELPGGWETANRKALCKFVALCCLVVMVVSYTVKWKEVT